MSSFVFNPSHLAERWGRVIGSEHELHTLKGKELADSSDAHFPKVSGFFPNGGKAYWDVGHYEVCSPEASNPLALVCMNRATFSAAQAINGKLTFFKNSADHSGHTSGAHESYLTTLDDEQRLALVPFLIALQPLIGAGIIEEKTGNYKIHQRAQFIDELQGSDTLSSRNILNTRYEPLSKVEGFYRMHHILNDANMSPAAELIKYGATALVLQGLEEGTLAPLPYNYDHAVDDLHAVSARQNDWKLSGTKPGGLSAVAVLEHYLNNLSKGLKVRSPLRNFVLDLWAEGLYRMLNNPSTDLVGFADWATKKYVLDLVRKNEKCGLKDDPCLVADMAYHNLNREQGVYFFTEEMGLSLLTIPQNLIDYHTMNPLKTTRAYARGKAVQLIASMSNPTSGGSASWEQCTIPNGSSSATVIKMDDPRKSYREEIGRVYKNGNRELE